MPVFARKEAEEAMVEVGRRMYARGFVAANDGNLSCRLEGGGLLATPAGVSKGFMTAEMLVAVDEDGSCLSGGGPSGGAPTSELPMHLQVYREDPAVGGVCHAHPPVATAFAAAGLPLDEPILSEALMLLGEVPIAPYATSGTDEVPRAIAPYVRTHRAVLMANHGVLTWGSDLFEAWHLMESVEHYATILLNAKYLIGRTSPLTPAQIKKLKNR